jgi:ATP-dependent RNA helicase DeaD
MVKANIQEIPLPNRKDIISAKSESVLNDIASNIKNDYKETAKGVYTQLVESGLTAEQIALSLIDSRISKELENVPEFDIPQPLKNRKNADGSNVKTVKIDISVGRNQKIAPNFILGALVEATGMSGKNFGKIDIFDSHTTVEVPKDNQELVISSLSGGKINGNKVTVRLYEGRKDNKSRGDKQYKQSGYRKQRSSSKREDFYSFDKSSKSRHNKRDYSNKHNHSSRRGKSFNSKG